MGYTFYFLKLQGNSLKVLVKVIAKYWTGDQEFVPLFVENIVAFIGMQHLNYRNATILLRNATPFFVFFL